MIWEIPRFILSRLEACGSWLEAKGVTPTFAQFPTNLQKSKKSWFYGLQDRKRHHG